MFQPLYGPEPPSADQPDNTFAPLDLQDLESKGMIAASLPNGTRKIPRRRTTDYADGDYGDIALDISPTDPGADEAYRVVPEKYVSQATLDYVGFDEAAAGRIWERCTAVPRVIGYVSASCLGSECRRR